MDLKLTPYRYFGILLLAAGLLTACEMKSTSVDNDLTPLQTDLKTFHFDAIPLFPGTMNPDELNQYIVQAVPPEGGYVGRVMLFRAEGPGTMARGDKIVWKKIDEGTSSTEPLEDRSAKGGVKYSYRLSGYGADRNIVDHTIEYTTPTDYFIQGEQTFNTGGRYGVLMFAKEATMTVLLRDDLHMQFNSIRTHGRAFLHYGGPDLNAPATYSNNTPFFSLTAPSAIGELNVNPDHPAYKKGSKTVDDLLATNGYQTLHSLRVELRITDSSQLKVSVQQTKDLSDEVKIHRDCLTQAVSICSSQGCDVFCAEKKYRASDIAGLYVTGIKEQPFLWVDESLIDLAWLDRGDSAHGIVTFGLGPDANKFRSFFTNTLGGVDFKDDGLSTWMFEKRAVSEQEVNRKAKQILVSYKRANESDESIDPPLLRLIRLQSLMRKAQALLAPTTIRVALSRSWADSGRQENYYGYLDVSEDQISIADAIAANPQEFAEYLKKEGLYGVLFLTKPSVNHTLENQGRNLWIANSLSLNGEGFMKLIRAGTPFEELKKTLLSLDSPENKTSGYGYDGPIESTPSYPQENPKPKE